MSNDTPKLLLPYVTPFFVNRRQEILNVLEFLQLFLKQESSAPHRLAFMGDRGAGKTWFSLHIHHLLSEEGQRSLKSGGEYDDLVQEAKLDLIKLEGLRSFTICLNPPNADELPSRNVYSWSAQSTISDSIQELLIRLGQWVGLALPTNVGSFELATLLARGFQKEQNQKKRWLIIVDSLFEADEDIVRTLEENLLSQVCNFSHVVLMFTGRGNIPVWKTPELRLNKDNILTLKKFNSEDIDKQIRALSDAPEYSPNQTEFVDTEKIENIIALEKEQLEILQQEVQSLSGGFPLNTYLLAAALSPPPSSLKYDTGQKASALDSLLQNLLGNNLREREILQALSILDYFQGWEVEALIVAYFKGLERPEADFYSNPENRRALLDIRTRLPITHLVKWDHESHGYIINESLRFILEKHLELAHSALWKELHQVARDLYDDLVDGAKTDDRKKRYQERVDYHNHKLGASNS